MLAAAEWLEAVGWPTTWNLLNLWKHESPGNYAAKLCGKYGISRRRLDVAINIVKDGLAYPSEGFLNLRAMAQRLAGRELTAAELRGLVAAYKQGQQDEQIG